MNDSSVERVSTIKDLGIVLNKKLTSRIEHTCASAVRTLGFIKKNTFHFYNIDTCYFYFTV